MSKAEKLLQRIRIYYTYKTLTLSVPYKRPHLKEAYVKQALLYIDSVLSQEGEG